MAWELVPIGDGAVSIAVETDDEASDVRLPGDTGLREAPVNLPVLTTPAAPGEADPAKSDAPQLSVRLLDAHTADGDCVKEHAA
jgi:hypothetical protein